MKENKFVIVTVIVAVILLLSAIFATVYFAIKSFDKFSYSSEIVVQKDESENIVSEDLSNVDSSEVILKNPTNEIIKITHYDDIIFENDEFYYVANDFQVSDAELEFLESVVLKTAKDKFLSEDVEFYSGETRPYYTMYDPDTVSLTLYGTVLIKDVNEKETIKEFEADFTGNSLNEILFFD